MGGKWNYWEGVFGELDFRVHSGPEFWTVADFRGLFGSGLSFFVERFVR